MTLFTASGTQINEAALGTYTDAYVPAAKLTVLEDIYETYKEPGALAAESGRRLKFKAGQVVLQSVFDAIWPTATFTSITPATGPAAGGTPVTIIGTNLLGATGATIGAVAVTSFVVRSKTKITCVTGPHAAGAEDLVIADDAGNVTAVDAFLYV